ncbi:uncharacterized protein LOC109861278 [Pseudomyrmex gracilis]|uniref:uncharacterized protein LOC109861278 n=1 Tax=Pseudomyrmex gracilis TaxID=219809 RepID=UPI000994B25D|nr:uncharacterized protein LOC109861278 [Pseudomyrmex gracilis]
MSTIIQKLEIKNCVAFTSFRLLSYTYHFFRGICRFVPYVKQLILNDVLLVQQSTFLTNISNLTKLQKLKIISCFCLRGFTSDIDLFPFTCNCQKVKILDFRNTAIEEKLVEWFCQIEFLEELYLDCPKYLKNEWSTSSFQRQS